MKRSISQVAKIAGVDGSRVKHWCSVFHEYLGPSANPGKGTPRVFSDSDLLVILYVSHLWADDLEIPSIEAGLNAGDHYEKVFIEELYRHTPLLQEPPDGLNESWRHGVLLGGGGRHGFLEMARNYRSVAESMLKSALEKDDLYGRAYPVLFAYRHTLELYLKLIGEIDETTHSLARCMRLVEKRHGTKFNATMRGWILELEKIDPAGTAFRYAGAEPVSIRYTERWFDFRHFQFAMGKVFDVLDAAVLRTGVKGRSPKRRK
jgi:hypothetical protein